MRVPLSWLHRWAPAVDAPGREIAAKLIRAGLEVERVETVGADVTGVVVGQVLEIEELAGFKKPIRYVRVDTGEEHGVVCGATNFRAGDYVAVALPGAELPGGFKIGARETYGRTSEGMICSARELGIADEHSGILVLETGPERIGADVAVELGLRDEVLDIAVTPDRGYCFSVRGVAREAAIAFGVPFLDHALDTGAATPAPGYPVTVDDPTACRRYVARIVREVDPAARSPLWLQRAVTLAGMRPISLAVDVTNYVMMDLGQPLHAFDLDRLTGGIVVRRARAGERIVTLDGADRELHPEDLVIADGTGAVAMAGVMGGSTSEVSAATTNVLVESANFDAVVTARSSRRHLLTSEASKRFERGVDPDVCRVAADTAVKLLVTLGRGRADEAVTDVDHRAARPVVELAADLPARRAGVAYSRDTVVTRLADIGCAVELGDPLRVTPPSWRPDLTIPVDLAEEVMRLEGYDEIPSVLPHAPAGRGLTRDQVLRRRVGHALAAAGYVEVTPYPFLAESAFDLLALPDGDPRRDAPRIANPVSDEEPLLRTTLLPGLLAVAARNLSRGLVDLALYEHGPVFRTRPGSAAAPRLGIDGRPSDAELAALDAALPDQPFHVGAVLVGLREPAGHWGAGRAASWADAVEAARTVARAVDAELAVEAAEQAPWHPGRCAALRVGGTVAGWAGELHPRVCEAAGLPRRTCAMELDLGPVLAAAREAVAAPELSAYPPSAVDVALVVGRDVPAATVEAALREGAGALLEELRLFDVFTGPQVGEGRKSLAYTLRFRAPDATLTDELVNRMRDAAVAVAAERTGAVLRGA